MAVDSDPLNLYSSSISMEELYMLSLRLTAKHILYLVDAAYGGISREGNEENVNLDELDDIFNETAGNLITKKFKIAELARLHGLQEEYKAPKQ